EKEGAPTEPPMCWSAICLLRSGEFAPFGFLEAGFFALRVQLTQYGCVKSGGRCPTRRAGPVALLPHRGVQLSTGPRLVGLVQSSRCRVQGARLLGRGGILVGASLALFVRGRCDCFLRALPGLLFRGELGYANVPSLAAVACAVGAGHWLRDHLRLRF